MTRKLTAEVRRTTFDVLSASAEAYSLIGRRLYYTFDRLVAEGDRAEFASRTEHCTGDPFLLHIADDMGLEQLYIASAVPAMDARNAWITLIPASGLIGELEEQKARLRLRDRLLGLYADEYFEYDAARGTIRIFRIDRIEQTIAEVPLPTFFDRLRHFAGDEHKAEVDRFEADFRARKMAFRLRAPGHLLDKKEAEFTEIRGESVFEDGVYRGAAGLLRFDVKPGEVPVHRDRDPLTGLLQKAEITAAAMELIDDIKAQHTNIAIVDVDHFKQVNDTFGHMTGDKVLRRVASILVEEVGSEGLVGRIGGDEFMVIFFHVDDMENNRELLRSLKNRVSAAYPEGDGTRPRVTLSIGCAAYPKDAVCYEDVFRLADFAMYRAKHNGRDRYVIFDAKKHGELSDVLKASMLTRTLNSRGDMSAGDILCALLADQDEGRHTPLNSLLEEAAVDLSIQRIMLYAGEPLRLAAMAGEQQPDGQALDDAGSWLSSPTLQAMYDERGILVLNDIERIAATDRSLYEQMKRLNILSCVHLKGTDADGVPYILCLESVRHRITWSAERVRCYSLFRRLLKGYRLNQKDKD